MNSGQMMLSIAAIFFVSLLIINVNKSTGQRITELASNESIIQSTALAEGLFEEIMAKAFDEKTITNTVANADSLSSVSDLGKDGTELSNTSFDDIDDYNNYLTIYNSSGISVFSIRVNVFYVDEDPPYGESSIRTFLKQIRIAIDNQYLPTTLTFNRLVSY
ncbi:MAG: hypothetical protein P8X73_02620 [Ignavibacteriaceae bacterium]